MPSYGWSLSRLGRCRESGLRRHQTGCRAGIGGLRQAKSVRLPMLAWSGGVHHATLTFSKARRLIRSAPQQMLFSKVHMEETMTKLIALIFALAVGTSAQAMSLTPLPQPDDTITRVRQACGAGMHMVNGRCVTTPARRHVRRDVIRNR
jgi:hypothetical protein